MIWKSQYLEILLELMNVIITIYGPGKATFCMIMIFVHKLRALSEYCLFSLVWSAISKKRNGFILSKCTKPWFLFSWMFTHLHSCTLYHLCNTKKKVLDLINRFHAFLSVEWFMYSYIGEIKRVICCTSRSYNAYATGQFVMAKSSSIRNFEVSLDIFTP